MINDLMLQTGIDIPFPQAQITIHQPSIKEISYIGEDSFFSGCEVLNFSKSSLSNEDKSNLENKTDFNILMSIMNSKSPELKKNKTCATMVLSLIFPDYEISFNKEEIILLGQESYHRITEKCFNDFREILVSIFCLRKKDQEYNPCGDKSREIAQKLMKGRAAAAQAKGENLKQKTSVLGRYISILSIGNKQSVNDLRDYTIYQLFDAYERFDLKQRFDINLKARIAGAKDIEDVNWMDDIHK